MNERLLVISNNVLSETTSNGKTILSYIDSIPKSNVKQLYFSSEIPFVSGYDYYRISDKDIVYDRFRLSKRGTQINASEFGNESQIKRSAIPRNALTCLIREMLWKGAWKSRNLIKWLDEFNPTVVFFHAGDCIFAHNIFLYVIKRYKPRACVYITDDYVMDRKGESFISKYRRRLIFKSTQKVIKCVDELFTVSEVMREAYLKKFGHDSTVIVNMSESLYRSDCKPSEDRLTIIYAGSLYFGRQKVLSKVAEAVEVYNSRFNKEKPVHLNIYTNLENDTKDIMASDYIHICGKIGKKELVEEYNKADVLLFAESFEQINMDKTKYSMSTKVPEYLSLHKPIFLVGPSSVGSVDYLRDVAAFASSEDMILSVLTDLIKSEEYRRELAQKASAKYLQNHDINYLRQSFIKRLFGN